MIGERSQLQTEALRNIREQLRGFEDSQLADTAEALARTAELLERTVNRIDDLEGEILTPERAAIAFGFVDDEGRVMVEAFEKMSNKNGWPRVQLNARRFVYLKRELIAAVERMSR